jgi:hypothetical protein
MFNFIRRGVHSITSFFTGAAHDVEGAIKYAVHLVEHLGRALSGLFGGVGREWVTFEHDVGDFAREAEHLAGETVSHIEHVVTHDLPALARGAEHLATRIEHDAAHLAGRIEHLAGREAHSIEHYITGAGSWVRRHVLHPLEHRIGQIEHTITHDVAKAVQWVEHPERALEAIVTVGLNESSLVEHHLVPVLGRWLLRNATRGASDLASAVESFVTSLV